MVCFSLEAFFNSEIMVLVILVVLVVFDGVLVGFDNVFDIVLVVLVVHDFAYFGCFRQYFSWI